MNSYKTMREEPQDRHSLANSGDGWVAFLDKLIVFLVFAIVVTLTVPLCNYFYQ